MEKLKLDLPVLLPEIPDLKDQCVSRLTGTLEGREGIFRVHVKSEENPPQLCIRRQKEEKKVKKKKRRMT